MKKKNGFTLIEVSISVALLAVVILFVLNFINIIRKNEDEKGYDTKLELNKEMISEFINTDVYENEGINNITCDNYDCDILLNSGERRHLNLTYDSLKITYIDSDTNKILFSKKTLEDYPFVISLENKSTVFILNIGIASHPGYTSQIVSEK